VIVWPELVRLIRLETTDFWTLQWRALVIFTVLTWTEGTLLVITKQKRSAKPTPDLIADLLYWLLTPAVRVAARVTLLLVLLGFTVALGRELDTSLFDGFGPIARQPVWLATIELVLLVDLSSYWSHRLFHTVPWLWRFHAIHHSAKYIRWSTTGRVHPVNDIATYLLNTVPFFLLGFPLKLTFGLLPWVVLVSVAAHTQWNLAYGWLGNVIVSPRYHRWHHSHSSLGGNSNFSNMFSFWDRLFGTRYYPQDRVAEVFGLDVDDCPESYWQQLLYPFRKQRALTAVPAAEQSDEALPVPQRKSA
jgi:sterol desaturase/sphingolipid hydroxylase (fatty acid hydroxylase superfamily)